MKALTLPLALLGLLVVASAESLRSQIDAFSGKVQIAMLNKDMAFFSKTMKLGATADFKYTEAGKTIGFDRMVAGMQQGLAAFSKVTTAKAEVLTITEVGRSGSVKTRHTLAGTLMGRDKKTHTMKFVGESVDTYRKEGGKWKMASMTWKGQKAFMDGKPMDPSKMGG